MQLSSQMVRRITRGAGWLSIRDLRELYAVIPRFVDGGQS